MRIEECTTAVPSFKVHHQPGDVNGQEEARNRRRATMLLQTTEAFANLSLQATPVADPGLPRVLEDLIASYLTDEIEQTHLPLLICGRITAIHPMLDRAAWKCMETFSTVTSVSLRECTLTEEHLQKIGRLYPFLTAIDLTTATVVGSSYFTASEIRALVASQAGWLSVKGAKSASECCQLIEEEVRLANERGVPEEIQKRLKQRQITLRMESITDQLLATTQTMVRDITDQLLGTTQTMVRNIKG